MALPTGAYRPRSIRGWRSAARTGERRSGRNAARESGAEMYDSEAQRGHFHANEDKIGRKTVKEFDRESKGKKLPKRAGRKKKRGGKRK
jgi:hypothetical protein